MGEIRPATGLPPALQQKAADHGCVFAEMPSGGLGLCDAAMGYLVSGVMGYPPQMWERTPEGEESILWQPYSNRVAELARACKGVDPLDTYRFLCAGDWETACAEARDTALLTERALARALLLVPKPYQPDVLWSFYETGVDKAALATHVGPTWSYVEYPDQMLDHEQWAEMFGFVGFTRDGKPAQQPTGMVRLWRGSVPERRTDWSWTTEWETAHRYAHGGVGFRPAGTVWTAEVPASLIYACNDGRREAEWVVEVPEDLIVADTRSCGCPKGT